MKDAVAKSFGKNLERIRKEQEKSRNELAAAIGVNETSFGAYCVGRHIPSIEKILKLAEILDCSITDLLGDNPAVADRKIWEYRKKRAEKIISAANYEIEIDKKITITSKHRANSEHQLLKILPKCIFHFETYQDFIEVVEEIEVESVKLNIGFIELLEKADINCESTKIENIDGKDTVVIKMSEEEIMKE